MRQGVGRPIRAHMRRFGSLAVATVVTLVFLAVTVGLVSLFIPIGKYRGIPAQPVQLSGQPDSDVFAVAVAGPDTTWGLLFVERAGLLTGVANTQHVTDEAAIASRVEAWAAANMVLGAVPERWSAIDPGSGSQQVLEDVQCRVKKGECTAVLVEGPLDGVSYEEPVDVGFSLPSPGTLVPVLSVDPDALPRAETLAGWSGGSAGLAYSLSYLEYLTGERVTPFGMRVAATGSVAVTPWGDTTVLPVEAVEEKFVSAGLADVDVLFVPPGQGGVMDGVEVVEVASVADAVEWLCRNGAGNSRLC